MDQSQLNSLDPKMKAAYDRIMNTPTSPAAPTTQAPVAQQTAPVQQPSQPPTSPQPVAPTQPVQKPQAPAAQTTNQFSAFQPAVQPALSPMDPLAAKQKMQAYVADEVTGVQQSLKTIQIMYVVGGLVFFAVYALFWIKFFNVSSPF